MHKHNILILTFLWSLLISLLVNFVDSIAESDAIGFFYFPSILLSVLFSWDLHSPSQLSIVSSFVIYTLFYWLILLIIYAVIIEAYLFFRHEHHLDDLVHLFEYDGLSDHDQEVDNKISRFILDLEKNRRKHWVLQNYDDMDLTLDPQSFYTNLAKDNKHKKLIEKVLNKLSKKLQKKLGRERAEQIINQLHEKRFHVNNNE